MTRERRLLILIFIFAMDFRLLLGLFNREANDNHVDVVSWIADKHALPGKDDCWSCFQPKLYYIACAGLVKLFHVHDFYGRIHLMQLVNVFTGFFILLFCWKFIDKQNLSVRHKLLTFGFFAFNPCLTGINVQSTNDTPVIFCGVLAVYAADSFFRTMKISWVILLMMALITGALTKASAIVLAGAIGVVFLLKIFVENSPSVKWQVTKYFAAIVISFLLIVPLAGGYLNSYKQYGHIMISTWNSDPPPSFFKTTPVVRPGLQNMFEGFFTFRYFDMIKQPYITNEWNEVYPLHRTSLWSQLYGRTVFMHFDQWPPGWQSTKGIIIIIGRVLIMLGIVPLALFLIGLLESSFGFLRNLRRKQKAYFAAPQNYLHLVITLVLLASSVFYTYHYRDFSSMKSFYIFPGLLSFIKLFSGGLASLKSKVVISTTEIVLMIMVLFSAMDIVYLIYQLY